ncbi:cytochrome c biogenesis protein DipZ [Candidatus Woesebacteria bacterium]|nr:cytochrome c biogenesis protein DipZ [Candidatus Woesebacteria bacterium]
MLLLILFAFFAGLITILSPCILPLLPILLSSADSSGKQRPIGVVTGFVLSFTLFTLFLSTIVRISGIPGDSLRIVAMVVLVFFGTSLLLPQFQSLVERLFSRFANVLPSNQSNKGFFGGVVVGLSLGLLWTPCVGPILASVISLSLIGTVTAETLFIVFAYSLGAAIPMFLIMMAGSKALQKVPWLVRNSAGIQKAFGVLMILTAVSIMFNLDRRFQSFVLKSFPNYGLGLTQFEDADLIKDQITKVNQKPMLSLAGQKSSLAAELVVGGEWFNSDPLLLADLKGKVVLVDFWTYSCINCQRTLPYIRNWWSKYQDKGLVVIGVHSPEFEFEKVASNVQKAIADFGLTYPIMQDNNFATWRAYNNRYWPAKYLVDKDGIVRYTHFGEGKYDETESMIQTLLKETGSSVNEEISNIEYQRNRVNTPETYLGYARMEALSAFQKITRDGPELYTLPQSLAKDTFAIAGNWQFTPENASPSKNATLYLNFEAKEVYLVARPKNGSGTLKISLDGEQQSLGADVSTTGEVTVDGDRLYTLISLPDSGRHQLLIEALDENVELYAFTFG